MGKKTTDCNKSLRLARRRHEKIKADQLVMSHESKDFPQFWQKIKNDERIPNHLSSVIEEQNTPENIAEFWKNHYKNQFQQQEFSIEECQKIIQP